MMTFLCDGCLKPVDKPEEVGFVVKRHYCGTCKPNAEAFLEAAEKDQVAAQAAFASKREKLVKKFGANGFKLPDVI